ncbi:hypothetical protein PSAC2689_130052 [Paraburkholderia sacchari]
MGVHLKARHYITQYISPIYGSSSKQLSWRGAGVHG